MKGKDEIEFLLKEIKKSGYPLEIEIASFLESQKIWSVYTNTYFFDRDEGKGRELDIKAQVEPFEVSKEELIPLLGLTLLVQCKRIPGNAWIFFQVPGVKRDIPVSRVSLFDAIKEGSPVPYDILEIMGTHFEKCKTKATNFCEFVINSEESNKRTDNIWECVISLVKATSEEMRFELLDKKKFIEEETDIKDWLAEPFDVLNVFYPIVVFEGKIYVANVGKEISLNRQSHVQLIIDYKSGNYEGKFCIDFIERQHFSSFFQDVMKDTKVFKKRIAHFSKKYVKDLKGTVKGYFRAKSGPILLE